jgi:hypothetical protein
MSRRIIVQIDQPGAAAPPERADLQDYLLIAGLALVIGGVASINWKAAVTLAGLLCLFFHFLVSMQKARRKRS